MEKQKNIPVVFREEEIDWEELAGIGILRDELEAAGEFDTLLRGEKTGVLSLSLVLLGVDIVMDATLQLVRQGAEPLIEIVGVKPAARRPFLNRPLSGDAPGSGFQSSYYDCNLSRKTERRRSHRPHRWGTS